MSTHHDPSDNNLDRNPFYRLNDESDADVMLAATETSSIGKSRRTESKASCYELQAIETAGFSEESIEKAFQTQRMNHSRV